MPGEFSGVDPRRKLGPSALAPGTTPGGVWVWNGVAWLPERITSPVELATLGPDLTGASFGATQWDPGNFIGLWSRGQPFATGVPALLGGYCAQEDEDLLQITVAADNAAPVGDAVINVWIKPSGGVFSFAGYSFTVPAGEDFFATTVPLALNLGDRVAFELDAASAVWSLDLAAITISALRAKRY